MSRPRTAEERALDLAQRRVTRGQLADVERKRLILQLWEAGMPQAAIAQRMTRASVAEGGAPISDDAVSHIVRRYRKENT